MRKRRIHHADNSDLRRRAEEALAARGQKPLTHLWDAEAQRLVQELEVHQIELELQNEELRTARQDTEIGLKRYTELFDFAPIGHATLDAAGTIREINHAGARLLGVERSRLVGTSMGVFFPRGDILAFNALLDRASDPDADKICELQVIARGGVRRQVRLTASGLAGEPRMTLLAFEDITEQKAWLEKLERTEKALREADRNKDEFLAMLSHELRNPLAPIANSLFILARAEPGSEKAHKAREVIRRQVAHMARLVDDLLDVTRIARGKIELKPDRLELGTLVRRTMDDYRMSFEASGVRLEGRFEAAHFWVDADPTRLTQALSNLLNNAEKFTPRGGIVIVSLHTRGQMVALRVSDSGMGIPPDIVPHVFEAFSQAPQTIDRTRGGLGLGLAMVKGLVELHGGQVSVHSEGPGKGSEFTVLLPLRSAALQQVPVRARAPSKSRRVLVIDDHPDAAESLRDGLALSGHDVQVAFNGPSGLELARKFRPEVTICDIGLPGMDGYAVARTFREDPALHYTYLIALSGYAQPEDLQRSTEAGFNQHVAKPPDIEKLDELLSEMPEGERGEESDSIAASSLELFH